MNDTHDTKVKRGGRDASAAVEGFEEEDSCAQRGRERGIVDAIEAAGASVRFLPP
jgi:hypothetical protein